MSNCNKKRIKDQYDYENAFDKPLDELNEIFIEEMMKTKPGMHYATKSIKSGRVFEVEIYPWFNSLKDVPRVKMDNSRSQNNLNDKNSRKWMIRIINENFEKNDLWLTFTHHDDHHPKTERQAKRNITNYLRRVNRIRKKRGLKNAKYLYITEWEEGPEGTRCHYHVLMEKGIDRDTLEDMWYFAVRNDSTRLHPDEEGISGLAAYMADKKRNKGERRWTSSKNLKRPKPSVSHAKIRSHRQVERMAKDYEEIRTFFEKEKRWKKYEFLRAEVMYNEFNSAFYIHITAREREWESHAKKNRYEGHHVFVPSDFDGGDRYTGKNDSRTEGTGRVTDRHPGRGNCETRRYEDVQAGGKTGRKKGNTI